MRLNVYLQKAGIGSRREAERLVAEGRVAINGAIAAATTPVNDGDAVLLDGKSVAPETRPAPRLFMLNKPLGALVTNSDPQGRLTIYDLPAMKPPQWRRGWPRVMNVGRLDVNSEGLLLLSSDGPLAQTMMSPATALKRVYRVRVRGRLTPAALAELAKGVTVDDIIYRGVEIEAESDDPKPANCWYRVVLTEGKNREIRRLMEHFGCVVNRLIRIQYGPFELGGLAPAAVMEIAPDRVLKLVAQLAASSDLRNRRG
jgi:23S rRNA pseudouridine2605 synthase